MSHFNNSQFAAFLDLSPRQARETSAKLESLGFTITRGLLGDRKIPQPLALAVKKARDADKPIKSLLGDPSLSAFRSRDETDPLQVLLQSRADLSILRQAVAPIVDVLKQVSPDTAFRWDEQGVPEPESEQF